MKITRTFSLLLIGSAFAFHLQAQDPVDSTGLPGDNFSLQGALEMFKKAGSPEELEKLLNTESNEVNNLDLNNDGETDYIRVIDKMQDDVHAIILQVPVSSTESQDVAVIELEKTGAENAVVQIVGDEDLYGEKRIVEPVEEETASVMNESGHGPNVSETAAHPVRIIVNVWGWPFVRFVYRPAYVVWVSPWHWGARPVWYRPWRPRPFAVFYPHRAYYHNRFAVVNTHRLVRAQRLYRPVRVVSVSVRARHQGSVTRYRSTRPARIHDGRGQRRAAPYHRNSNRRRR